MVETKGQEPDKYQFLKSSYRFTRMRTRGAIPPPFRVIQVVTALVNREYQAFMDDCRNEALMAAAHLGKSISGVNDADPTQDLARHLVKALSAKLKKAAKDVTVDQKTLGMLRKQMLDAQTEFFTEFQADADMETQARVVEAFSRDETFEGRLDVLRAGYLKNAVERIGEGKSTLRKMFIETFGEWIAGDRPDLTGFDDVVGKVREEAGTFSKFFSRDQFSRFNRALTIATYDGAGAKWVQWVTVGDQRVRKSHRRLQNKIFRIDDLPKEYLDYLCRCALLPVFDIKNRIVSKGDSVSMTAKAA